MKPQSCRVIFAAIACLLYTCGTTGPTAGSETTNGVSVTVAASSISGSTSPDATVMLFDAARKPDDTGAVADTIAAGPDGTFAFESLPPGTYNVFVYPPDRLMGAVVPAVAVGANDIGSDSARFDTTASVSGLVYRDGLAAQSAKVYIPGSPFVTTADTDGGFILNQVPRARYTIVAELVTRTYGVAYADSQTIDVGPSGKWNTFVTLTLDTIQ